MRLPSPEAPATRAAADQPYDDAIQIVGRGPPLVYVPGMDGTGQLFYTQIPALARDYTVATYRLRDDARDMEALVADLTRVAETAAARADGSGRPAVLVAESFGGALAMSFALAHPARVRALVVLNSFPHFRPQLRLQLAVAAIRMMPWGVMRIVRRVTASRLHSRHTHRDEVRRFLALTARTTRRGYLNRLRILRHYDVRDRLAALRVPVLYLAADQDHLIPSVEQARLMAARARDATTLILHGHGHSCFLARSLDLHAILAEWPALARDASG